MLSRAIRPLATQVAKRGIEDMMRGRVVMANASRALVSARSGGRGGAVARRDTPRRGPPALPSLFDDFLSFADDPFLRPVLSTLGRTLADRDLVTTLNMNLDISETPKEYIVRAELPGVKKEDVKVSFSDGVLTISADRKEERVEEEGAEGAEGRKVHYSDFVYGHIERSIRIPEGADPESIQASLDNGVLTVKIAKTKPQEAKTIQIQ